MQSVSYFQAADAATILFGVSISHCSNKRLPDGTFNVFAFVRGKNHAEAAQALRTASRDAATVENLQGEATSVVTYLEHPQG